MEFEYITLSSNGFNRLSDWIVVKVKDVAKVNELSIKTVSKLDIIEYIDVGSVDGGKIVEVQSMPFSKAPSRAKRIVGDNDILISTVMPNLKHYTFIKIAKSNTVASTGFAIITSYKAEPRYLYYYLISDPFMNYLSQIADAHTSAYPAFNPDIIEDAELLLPPFPVQQKITFILGSLDDKIELNHKMNKTLEQMLQAIFKHWFFDFEFPNEKGKPYKSSEGEIVYSEELGKEIPNGWDVTQISDIAKVTSGKRPTIVHEKQSTDPPVPVYGGSRIMSYT
ncbi:MAG: restriction endonuclease subunit S, partial [Candidatus Nanoarchaeia archaeon]|nr:restriction endonuclease subunit S [Candidatus Jingweiarchaeum tengchongense]